jgi:hypothetical protein
MADACLGHPGSQVSRKPGLHRIWRHGYFPLFGLPCGVDANFEHAPIMTRALFSILLPSRNRLQSLRHAVDSWAKTPIWNCHRR